MPFYAWEAEKCFLDTVDADKFCRVMEGRKGLLFVGEYCLVSRPRWTVVNHLDIVLLAALGRRDLKRKDACALLLAAPGPDPALLLAGCPFWRERSIVSYSPTRSQASSAPAD